MAREILGLALGDPLQPEHINRDRLDNRRANLRVATHAQNCQNVPAQRDSRSGLRGVRPMRGGWQAYATIGGRFHHLGCYREKHQAAEAAERFRAERMPYAVA